MASVPERRERMLRDYTGLAMNGLRRTDQGIFSAYSIESGVCC